MTTAAKNMKTIRERHGLSQAAFATKIEVSTGLIGLIESGTRELSRKTANKIAEEFGIDPDLLFQEEMEIPIEADPYRSQYPDCILVEAKALASFPSVFVPDGSSMIGRFKIPGLQYREKPYLAVKVEGPSMEPTIRQGDVIIVDEMESRAEFADDRVYVVIIEGMALVKRVKMVVEGEVKARLISDNGNTHQDVPFERIQKMYKALMIIKDFM